MNTDRLHQYRSSSSIFDNSWDIYNQDMPTAKYMLNHGYESVIVKSNSKVEKDLGYVLYEYQKLGIKIYYTNGETKLKEVKLRKPKKKDEVI